MKLSTGFQGQRPVSNRIIVRWSQSKWRPETAYSLQHIIGIKWITKLKPNNLLVSNDVNANFTAEAYISTAGRWGYLFHCDMQLPSDYRCRLSLRFKFHRARLKTNYFYRTVINTTIQHHCIASAIEAPSTYVLTLLLTTFDFSFLLSYRLLGQFPEHNAPYDIL